MKKLTILCLILLTSCVSTGVKVPEAKVDTLKVGETTITQTISSLGAPTMKSKLSSGETILMYSYAEYTARASSFIPFVGLFAGGADVRASFVQLVFDKNGLFLSSSATESQYGSGTGLGAGHVDMTKAPHSN